ncbi:peroxiredoxin-5, mitochondrial-like [Physella acuta]|uniref:peroxiredoxin-5, mitochondrial-like n=1 Tax=Physella acuta TaxID=109671 RepID=UPI0027DD4C96|nr:peroxiredoxin-5, mitochondrial-like [Physella acuta]
MTSITPYWIFSFSVKRLSKLLPIITIKQENSRLYSSKYKVQVGDELPNVNLYEKSPNNPISAVDLYKGKKGVLFAVVGAFTPGCTNSHIPDYLSLHEKFQEEGYMISCVSVNDPFVMEAWGKSTNALGKIRMLADPRGEFTKALGMEIDCKQLLGGIRSQKYSLVIDDGKIQSINVDPEHTGLACLLCIKNMKADDVPVAMSTEGKWKR